MKPFFDTNIFVYGADRAAGERGERANSWIQRALADRSATISTRVLQEFYDRATRKLHIAPAVARAQVRRLTSLPAVQVSPALVLAAAELQERRRISFWDALIVRAALTAECDELWTEDLQAGAEFDGVRVVNPFA